MSNRAALRIEAVTRGWLTRRRLSVVGCKAATHPPSDDSTGTPAVGSRGNPVKRVEAQEGDSCREGTNRGKRGCYSAPEKEQAFQETPEPKASSSSSFAPRAAPGVATLKDLGAEGVRAFFDSLGLAGCADVIRRALGPIAGHAQADGEPSAKTDLDGVGLARIAGAADTNAELLALGVRARLHRIKILTALGLSRASSAGNCSSTSHGGSTDFPCCISSSTAVAAAAAHQMARRLNEEQEAMLTTVARIRRRVQQSTPECKERDNTEPAAEVTQAFDHPRNEREVECDSDGAEFRCCSESSCVSSVSGAARCGRPHKSKEGSGKSYLSDLDGIQGSRVKNPTRNNIMCSSVSVSLLGELEAAVAAQAILTSQVLDPVRSHLL